MAYYKRERTTTTLSIDMGNSSDDESSTIEISNYRSYQSVYTESVPRYVIPKPSYPVNKRQLAEVATTPIPENVKPARSSRSSISFLLNPVSRKDEPEEEEEEQEDEHDSSPLPQSPVFHSSPKSAFKPIINQTAPLQPPRAMQISNILSPPTADNNDLPSPFTPSPSISPSPVASTSMPSSSTSNNLLSNLSTLRKTIGLINHAPLRAPTTAISLPTPTRVELVAPASVDTPSTSPRKASSRTPSSSPVSGNDDTPAATKKRKRAAPDQLQVLEETFKRDPLPNSATKQRLAQELGMSPRRVTIWFQNKRARLKKGGGKEKPSKKELLTFHHLGMQDGNLTLHSDGCEPVVMPPTLQRVPKRKLPSHRRGRLTQHQTTPTLNYPAIDDQQHL